eukprot:gnl/Dysnectes_brevis/7230_a11928_426.p1 GENE.gnl/Dysnectes_brevis/7230_a11928_426~~gnl/Dysnectes_brevis/7230_a11928_426.p1  ORF type:complete len:144 (-),score=19.99 gnl/Dysnectes_brevis/7230_a11928_426:129-536(-)
MSDHTPYDDSPLLAEDVSMDEDYMNSVGDEQVDLLEAGTDLDDMISVVDAKVDLLEKRTELEREELLMAEKSYEEALRLQQESEDAAEAVSTRIKESLSGCWSGNYIEEAEDCILRAHIQAGLKWAENLFEIQSV